MEKQYEIGNLITEQRKRKNFTQRELADALGVTDKSVSKWENGRSLPDTKIMPRLREVLGISVGELLEGKLKPFLPKLFATLTRCHTLRIQFG